MPKTVERSGDRRASPSPSPSPSRAAWSSMCDLVLHNVRRREVSDALGMSFGKVRAIRRLAVTPMAMSELAAALEVDAPYATVLVDDLESQGLVRRRPHPRDRRAKLVEATRKGKETARRAEAILGTPPPALDALSTKDLETLVKILHKVGSGEG
jgi:DNA-binding MarR family transcriptional regulator